MDQGVDYFSVLTLKTLLNGSVLRGSHKLPQKVDLVELVRELNDHCIHVRAKNSSIEMQVALESTGQRGIQLLEFSMKGKLQIIEKIRQFSKAKDSGVVIDVDQAQRMTDQEQAIKLAELAIDLLRGTVFVQSHHELETMTAEIHGWPDSAEYLARLFRKAMEGANPGIDLGVSNGGPVSRFVSAVMPAITGESVRPETVSAHLKSLRRKKVASRQ